MIPRTLTAIAIVLAFAFARAGAVAQAPGVLKITVTVTDADGRARPVPRHAVLISDNPVSAAPQRLVTTIDGRAEIRLKPGNYTVESDEPLIFQGRSYEWVRAVDVAAGRDTLLELTAANAQIATAAVPAGGAAASSGGASALLIDWQDSVVTIWSPTSRGLGFVIDARGLIATHQRLVGTAASVEVQPSPATKVAARVVAADADTNVAILWVDPAAVASARPMRLGYAREIAERDKVFAIEAPLDDSRSLASGVVRTVNAHTITTNVNLDDRSAGAPLFTEAGDVVAITTTRVDDERAIHEIAPGAVRIDDARAVIAAAEQKIAGGGPPAATPLPIEPARPFDDEALRIASRARAGRLGAYLVAADDFDVSVITPVMLYGVRHREERTTGERGRPAGNPDDLQKSMRAVADFANWDDYVDDYPPVVLIRVTPKLVEGFWTSVARGAAQTQGVSIPPIKHFKAAFGRLQLFCGDAEVTPIHPFRLEQRVSEREVIREGLYVFAPDAIGPQCGSVRLALFSDKDAERGETRPIDAKIVQQIWDDFAPYRQQGGK